MDILHTFEFYQLQLKDMHANESWTCPQVLRAFRGQFQRFSAADITTLTTFLTDNRKNGLLRNCSITSTHSLLIY